MRLLNREIDLDHIRLAELCRKGDLSAISYVRNHTKFAFALLKNLAWIEQNSWEIERL